MKSPILRARQSIVKAGLRSLRVLLRFGANRCQKAGNVQAAMALRTLAGACVPRRAALQVNADHVNAYFDTVPRRRVK